VSRLPCVRSAKTTGHETARESDDFQRRKGFGLRWKKGGKTCVVCTSLPS
jgi:hypothetical protein